MALQVRIPIPAPRCVVATSTTLRQIESILTPRPPCLHDPQCRVSETCCMGALTGLRPVQMSYDRDMPGFLVV